MIRLRFNSLCANCDPVLVNLSDCRRLEMNTHLDIPSGKSQVGQCFQSQTELWVNLIGAPKEGCRCSFSNRLNGVGIGMLPRIVIHATQQIVGGRIVDDFARLRIVSQTAAQLH